MTRIRKDKSEHDSNKKAQIRAILLVARLVIRVILLVARLVIRVILLIRGQWLGSRGERFA